MSTRLAALAATAVLAVVAALAAPLAEAVIVTLQVEAAGAPAPLFDGTIDTVPHAVDGSDGSGPHPCWGPPGGTPVPTATGALDDALRATAISWRGNWNPSFRDFFVDRIGPFASAAPNDYWSLSVNGRFSAGGCLTQVLAGDSVRFVYGPLFGPGPPTAPGGAEESPDGPAGEDAPGGGRAGPSAKALRRVVAGTIRYLRRKGGGEAWARLALSLHGRGSPAVAAGKLIAGKLGSQMRDGSFGRDVNATALATLALRRANPQAASRAAAWLAGAQSAGGGFGYRPGIPPDVDTTGLASWALALESRQVATLRAASFIRSAQAADGGFPALPGGASNAQSTALAIVALRVAGLGPRRTLSASARSPLDYLVSLARRDGSIAYRRHDSPTPVWTTAQALVGLTSRAKLLGSRSGTHQG